MPSIEVAQWDLATPRDHGLQHLGGGDDELPSDVGLRDHHLLCEGHLVCWRDQAPTRAIRESNCCSEVSKQQYFGAPYERWLCLFVLLIGK